LQRKTTPAEDVGEREAERVEVALGERRPSIERLGRGELRGPADGAGGVAGADGGHPEVHEDGSVAVGLDDDVRGLAQPDSTIGSPAARFQASVRVVGDGTQARQGGVEMRLTLFVALLLVAPCAAQDEEGRIEDLVRQLGAESAARREQASQELKDKKYFGR
jgi:hypothetical protein